MLVCVMVAVCVCIFIYTRALTQLSLNAFMSIAVFLEGSRSCLLWSFTRQREPAVCIYRIQRELITSASPSGANSEPK